MKKIIFLAVLLLLQLSGKAFAYDANLTATLRELEGSPGFIEDDDLESYISFPGRYASYAKPITYEKLLEKIRTEEKRPWIIHAERHLLKNQILSSLNLRFMVSGPVSRLNYTKQDESRLGNITVETYHIDDPYAGRVQVVMLVPPYPGHSAIIALHGHGDNPEKFRKQYLGEELAEAGHTVIIPKFRAMGYDETEINVSLLYLQNGFSLMGMRTYETLLAIGFAKEFGYQDIGLMGHSGGSTVALLAAHVSKDIDALVFDHHQSFTGNLSRIHCEYVPGLISYNEAISSTEALNIPVLRVSYNYTNEEYMIKSFFYKTLKPLQTQMANNTSS